METTWYHDNYFNCKVWSYSIEKKRSEVSCQWWVTLILRLAIYSTLSLAVRLAVELDQTDPLTGWYSRVCTVIAHIHGYKFTS